MTLRHLVAGTIILLASGSAHAQSARPDPRWQPWLGCWMPTVAEGAAVSAAAARPVCVVPAAGASAVDIVTIDDGREASREHIEATGQRRQREKDGCTGWESAEWSADSRRVYLRSDYQCSNGVKRGSNGLFAVSPRGEFLNVAGVRLGETTGVGVVRHRSIPVGAAMPREIAAALEKMPPGDEARLVAATPVATSDVVDASRALDAAVVQAWLSALGQTFTLDAKRLVQLADAGVSGDVIDVMVALSYPGAFAIKPSTTFVGSLGSAGSFGMFDEPAIFGDVWYGYFPYAYFPYGYYSPYRYSPYGYSSYGYSPYGYGAYGDWYYGRAPVVITLKPAESGTTHGQVVNGRGYSSGSSASGSSGSSSSGSSGASSSGGSVGASSGGERTAHPR